MSIPDAADSRGTLRVLPSGACIRVLFEAEAIAARVQGLAAAIARTAGPNLLVVAVLKGSFVFAADLLRALYAAGIAPEVDFLTLSSYSDGTVSSGTVRIVHDVPCEIAGRDVLIVDDIMESGHTMRFAHGLMTKRGARTIRSCVLLDKSACRAVPVEADFWGFRIPDIFVVGYGMDAAHRFRELPYIGTLQATNTKVETPSWRAS